MTWMLSALRLGLLALGLGMLALGFGVLFDSLGLSPIVIAILVLLSADWPRLGAERHTRTGFSA